MVHHAQLRDGLRAVWVLVIVWFELGTFQFAASRCHWPDTRQVRVSPLPVCR